MRLDKILKQENKNYEQFIETIDNLLDLDKEEVDNQYFSFSERKQPMHPSLHRDVIWDDEIEVYLK